MKNWFFHQEKGNTLGPITLGEIKNRVREGRIRLFDLVYREGEPGWRMALEHPDLRGEFRNSTVKTMVDRPWVVLQRKSDSGFDFGTSGPFSSADIRLNLQEGVITYSDYIWRDGFHEWKRIGALEDFNRRLGKARADKDRLSAKKKSRPLAEVPAQELLKNVVEMKRPQPPLHPSVPAPPPPEATTPDLTSQDAPSPAGKRKVDKPVEKKSSAKRAVRDQVEGDPPRSIDDPPQRHRSVWLDWMVVGLLAAVLGVIVLALPRYMQAPSVEEPRVNEPVVPTPPVPVAATPGAGDREKAVDRASDAKTPSEAPPETAPEKADLAAHKKKTPHVAKNVAPTELLLNVQNSGPNQVKIELRTDAVGDDYPVYFQVVGLPGQVAEGASFYKFMKLIAKGERKEPFDLSGLNLPQGKFIIRAETGTLKKEARMSVGVHEAVYKQTVARLRKTHAHAIWKERLELFRLSQLLEKQLIEAAGGKKINMKGLEAINRVKRTNGANYILYDQWYEMKEILGAAKIEPSMALLGRLKQAREKLSTFSVWK